MQTLNHLKLRSAVRRILMTEDMRVAELFGRPPQTRSFLDFVVDGSSLYDELRRHGLDLISCLGWGSPKEHQEAVERLLIRDKADFKDGRRSLFVDPEDRTVEKGSISIIVEKEGEVVEWRDFGYQRDPEANPFLGPYKEIGPFRFPWKDYQDLLEQSIDRFQGR